MRWRCRTAQRRAFVLVLPFSISKEKQPSAAVWRHTALARTPWTPPPTTLQVGDFVVGAEGDPQLMGHPDIRY